MSRSTKCTPQQLDACTKYLADNLVAFNGINHPMFLAPLKVLPGEIMEFGMRDFGYLGGMATSYATYEPTPNSYTLRILDNMSKATLVDGEIKFESAGGALRTGTDKASMTVASITITKATVEQLNAPTADPDRAYEIFATMFAKYAEIEGERMRSDTDLVLRGGLPIHSCVAGAIAMCLLRFGFGMHRTHGHSESGDEMFDVYFVKSPHHVKVSLNYPMMIRVWEAAQAKLERKH